MRTGAGLRVVSHVNLHNLMIVSSMKENLTSQETSRHLLTDISSSQHLHIYTLTRTHTHTHTHTLSLSLDKPGGKDCQVTLHGKDKTKTDLFWVEKGSIEAQKVGGESQILLDGHGERSS